MGLLTLADSIPWDTVGTVGAIIFALLLLIQITPIKLDPFGRFFRMVGKNLNQGMMENMEDKLDDIYDKLTKLQEDVNAGFCETKRVESKLDYRMAFTRRAHILRFSDEVMHEMKHSQEMFNQVLDDIKEYDRYCKEHPEFENNRTVVASERIRDVYAKCIKENDFL